MDKAIGSRSGSEQRKAALLSRLTMAGDLAGTAEVAQSETESCYGRTAPR
jgi:hypothetical protein